MVYEKGFWNGFYVFSYVLGLVIVAASLLKLYLARTRGKYKIRRRLDGKVVIITGATDGIGKAATRQLMLHGATVHVPARNLEKARELKRELETETGNASIFIHRMDLGSFRSIREFAKTFLASGSPLHILINNAGVASRTKQLTEDGVLDIMQVNHFGPFLLTQLLLDRMLDSGPGCRIVNVSSCSFRNAQPVDFDDLTFEKQPYLPTVAYPWSKLFAIWFTRELARRLRGTGVTTNCLHPGFVNTHLTVQAVDAVPSLRLRLPFAKTPDQGAQTVLHAALAEELEHVSGHYFQDCQLTPTTLLAMNDRMAEKLWEVSEKITDSQTAGATRPLF